MSKKKKVFITLLIALAIVLCLCFIKYCSSIKNEKLEQNNERFVTESDNTSLDPFKEESSSKSERADKTSDEEYKKENGNIKKTENKDESKKDTKDVVSESTSVTSKKRTDINSDNSSSGNSNSVTTTQQPENTDHSSTNNNSNANGNNSKPSGSHNSNNNDTAKPACKHNWTAQTKTVHHPAVTHTEQKLIKAAYEEPVYEEQPVYEEYGVNICNKCGADITGREGVHGDPYLGDGCDGSWHYEVRYGAQIGTELVQVGSILHDAVYQTVVITDKAAYDETVITGYKCSICGAAK